MSSNNRNADFGRGAGNRADHSGAHTERVRDARGSDVRRLDRAAYADDEVTLLGREQKAAAREDAVHQRECAAGRREDVVQAREGHNATREYEIRNTLTRQSTAADQMSHLQQANANLVVATMEARKLAEEVQTVKVKLDHLAHHDVLTGLPNRALMNDRLAQAISLAQRSGKQLAVLFMDVDRFKYINDSLGHTVGDQLLQSVSQRLLGCVRQSDTISRQGGDEFVALLTDIDHPEDAALAAQKMNAAIALPHHLGQYDLHIGLSIGISIYPDDGMDEETLIKYADTAMYHAKAKGRNTYAFFEPEMTVRAIARQSIEASLRLALERQEFVLHYQPIINLVSGMIVGAEALVRWQHPQRGLLEPAQFVPIAEDSGLILPLGRWVLREACRQARAWQDTGLPSICVTVNTSALEFRAVDFLEYLRATLEESRLEPRYLELELTESILMRDAASADSVLHALAELGVKLAIDDFGTGYSSLSYLRQFPINTLKIDKSFVNQITSNPDDAAIVSAVISMGKNLKRRVVAEGVESPEQAAFLLAQHCDEGQGYFFGQPMEAEALVFKFSLPSKICGRAPAQAAI